MPTAATSMPQSLTLGISGFTYADLYEPTRLRALFQRWHEELATADPALLSRYDAYRASQGAGLAPEALSELLVEVTPHVSRFVVRLFGIEAEWEAQRKSVDDELIVFRFKDEFVKRRAQKRTVTDETAARTEGERALARLGVIGALCDDERAVAVAVCGVLDREAALKKRPVDDPELVAVRAELAALEAWVVVRKPELGKRWLSYQFAHNVPDSLNLVQIRRPSAELPEMLDGPPEKRRKRDGFKLTDRRMGANEVLAQVDYCLYCHDRDKDSCSKGLRDNKTGAIKPNALGVDLNGCPLDEKISEMHLLKRRGDALGALALVCIDNPMLPGTGHRICNDCMKSCVFQKQEPVNIPQIETAVLTDVLGLPYGFEIYGLLTRWNPLNVRRPYPLPYRGKDVLVVGLGPAGYTLAHHLLNEGFGVVGIDGLKIEPLPASLVGDPRLGTLPEPVRNFDSLYGELDERILLGFGGVSEYGITVRWDKNFLTVVYASLLRRDKFRCYGGVRFGGTLTFEDVWSLGFDHVAIAVGAGKPTLIDMQNNLMRGIRKASDFLMGLQLTGAYKRSSPANLQVRLPALVIGGGLTAIDTATELLAYYVVQAEKTVDRHDRLVKSFGADRVRSMFDDEEREALDELLDHGRQLREEREHAAQANREPDFQPLLESWGGVAIVYRKKMTDSPAYRLNHEEVEKCLEEGVRFIEGMSPVAALPDEKGALRAMTFERQAVDVTGKWRSTGDILELPVRTLCVAAGTSPNTIYEKEFPGTFKLDKRGFFAPHRARRDEAGQVVLEPDAGGSFTSYASGQRVVSYYGDNHPKYAGSVVKAMASAKYGFLQVAELFGEPEAVDAAAQERSEHRWRTLSARLDDELLATVVGVNRLTPTIVEVIVRAPLAARRFQPGQFYRLQNFETTSQIVDGTRLTMEGLALTGAWTDPEKGLLSLIVLEMGGSSRLVAALKKGEPIVVMGPTGTPTEIPVGETVLLAGGGLGNAVLFSIGKALRAAGCKVVYFAGYRKREDVFKVDDIEAASDQIIWSVDGGPGIVPRRPQDQSFVGNVVQSMLAYAEGRLGPEPIRLKDVARLIAIGSDRMMRAVKEARHGVLAPHFNPNHVAVASINSPMQCMMKEVCAQCLQRHVDPITGKETIVFSCFNQDQPMDHVDFTNLASRLRANTVQEKLTNLWFEKLLKDRPDLRLI
jgi:NADPH-dependent glutamate synthase beta subunit-like oxidoreductase/NAD(P)H-flavin reductase